MKSSKVIQTVFCIFALANLLIIPLHRILSLIRFEISFIGVAQAILHSHFFIVVY
jgi:hypothetical protein